MSHLPENQGVYLELSRHLQKVGNFSVQSLKMFKTIFECLSCIIKAFKRDCGGQVSNLYAFCHACAAGVSTLFCN